MNLYVLNSTFAMVVFRNYFLFWNAHSTNELLGPLDHHVIITGVSHVAIFSFSTIRQ